MTASLSPLVPDPRTEVWRAHQALAGGVTERALVALVQALRPLQTVVSFMNTGAHPDDERSDLLACYSRGLGVRTISLIATRGEGGQNQVGDEQGRELAVVRTRELEEASRHLGVTLRLLSEDFDDPITDFGFSKTPEETLGKWGAGRVLERLVRALRELRPDVVMPSFRDEFGQHGHHRAMVRLTLEAVRLAGEADAFPGQLAEGLLPWKVRKVYLPANPDLEAGAVYLSTEAGRPTVVVDTGRLDPDLGVTYVQLGEESRALHRSQGMGRVVAPGPRRVYGELVFSRVAGVDGGQSGAKLSGPELAGAMPDGTGPASALPETSMFEGLPYTVADLAAALPAGQEALAGDLARLQEELDGLHAAFPNREALLRGAHRTLAHLRAVLGRLAASDLPGEVREDIAFRLRVKEEQLEHLSAVAALLVAQLRAQPCEVVPGQPMELELFAFNGGPLPLRNLRLELRTPKGWSAAGEQAAPGLQGLAVLQPGGSAKQVFRLAVPRESPFFHPYRPLDLTGVVRYEVDGVGVSVAVRPQSPVAVLPAVSLAPEPERLLLNIAEPGSAFQVKVRVHRQGPQPHRAAVQVELPEGWLAEPSEQHVQVGSPGEVQRAAFTLRPPSGLAQGTYRLNLLSDRQPARQVRVIEHGHIGRSYLVTPATLRVSAFPWRIAPVRVGYVSGGFDSVARSLALMGFGVTELDSGELLSGDLSGYDAIVLGVYAFRSRPDLLAANGRLLQYVERGGHLVVQLHRPWDNWDPDRLPPYRLVIGQPSFNWRVTDEAAPVTVLAPDHPLFCWPNPIGPEDWEGWVKDRGLYFPMEWAPEYTPLISVSDPGWEPMKGGMLLARYGEGSYLYTSLTWHHQLGHCVPGAFRIVANMVSLPAYRRQKED